MKSANADENLLFGVLALQMDFIDRSDLIAAVSDWIVDKPRRIAEILVERGAISHDECSLLENLVQKHLDRHDHDPHQSLTALQVFDDLRAELRQLNDPEVTTSLGYGSGSKRDVHAQETAEYTPQQTARFQVVRPHAKGGLGKVSVAVDRELNREVALKEIHAKYADHVDSRARFRLEAEITGGLEHPGVVPVYSLGAYADGRPYYAMRFIRGDSFRDAIKKFHALSPNPLQANQRRLMLRRLLGQLVDVCHVIQYAHDRGVLHRDLKPENVMVGEYGETLVVDWGLAKSLDDDSTPPPATGLSRLKPSSGSYGSHTLQGSAMGTPAYMSPEQAAGKHASLTPASDVYSLGATLYYLLADCPPIAADSVETALIKAQKGDFAPPREKSPWTPPPLNAICLKAMALSPESRYASAREFAADLERWLADEPVSAYRESVVERAARWLRRHRSWTLSAAASLVVVAVVATGALFLVNQARQEEERQKRVAQELATKNSKLAEAEKAAKSDAVRRFQQARTAVDTWLTGAASTMEYAPGMQQARRVLLERAAADYEKFAGEPSADGELELERARANVRLGDIRRQLGDLKEAERVYHRAEGILDQLTARAPDNIEPALERANCRTKRGLVLLGLEQAASGEALLKQALAESQTLVGRDPESPGAWQAMGTAWFNLGYAHYLLEDIQNAQSDFSEAKKAFEHLQSRQPADFRGQADLSQALAWLGRALFDERDNRGAGANLEQALRCFNELLQVDQQNPDYRNRRAEALVLLSGVQRSVGDVQGELDTLRKAVDDYASLMDAPREVLQFQQNYVVTRIDLAQLLHELGQTAAALAEFEKVLAEIDEFRSRLSDDAFWIQIEATCRDMQGESLRELARDGDAEAAHRAAASAFEKLAADAPEIPDYRERLALCRSHLGLALCAQGNLAEGEPLLRESLSVLGDLIALAPELPQYKDDAAFLAAHLGEVHWNAGQHEEAADAFELAIRHRRELAEKWPAAEYQVRAAWLLAACPVESQRLPADALGLAQAALVEAPKNADAWSACGAAQHRADDHTAAIASLQKAIELRPFPVASDYFYLALAFAQVDPTEATARFERGKSLMKEAAPGNLPLQRLREEAQIAVESR